MSFWALLIIIEVKISNYTFLKYMFFLSWLIMFGSFMWANKSAQKNIYLSYLQGIIITTLLILFSIVLGTNFKFMLGGNL